MKKYIFKNKISIRIVLPIVLSLLLVLGVIIGFAAYTGKSYVKGVAASPKQALYLYSDYLSVVSISTDPSKYSIKKVLFDEKDESDSTPYEIEISIQNTNGSNVAGRRMGYTLYVEDLPEGATVTFVNTGTNITTSATSISGFTRVGENAMPAYTLTTHEYLLTIPKDKIGSNIIVKAIPDEDSDTSGTILAAKIQPSIAGTVSAFSYTGKYADESNLHYPYEYSAFNYSISCVNAEGDHTMILSWDKTKVEIDPEFLKNDLGLSDAQISAAQSAGSVEFVMNLTNNSYLMKFYRVEARDSTSTWQKTWANMKSANVIVFSEATD